MSNFDPNSVTGLVGLWDFRSGATTADTGLDDGIAQNGHFHGNAGASGDRAHFDGYDDYFDVSGADAPFDLAAGTIEVQFTQDQHIGSSPDTLVSRGEAADWNTEGYFSISVLADGSIQAMHCMPGQESILTTNPGFFSPGDTVNVKYTWDESSGAQLVVENLTTGGTATVSTTQTGLTMAIGDNDDENFTFGAREQDDGVYDREFDGSIDYVAIYESSVPDPQPDGAVDGEDFGEVMDLGYDDGNAPTDQGGDIITNDADLIFGNGGDDTIDGNGGDDTIYGDSGTSGPVTREIFQWDEQPDFANDVAVTGFTQDTGSANITFSIDSTSAGSVTEYENSLQDVSELDAEVGDRSSMENVLNGEGNQASYSWESDVPLQNLEFRINDIDGDGVVRVRAFDEFGNPIEVTLSDAGSGLSLSNSDGVPGNDTATSIDSNYTDDSAAEHSVLVSIAGPVSRWEVIHEQDGANNSGINITDIAFDANAGFGADGDDDIEGGAGDDLIFGEGGNDDIEGGTGADTIYGDSNDGVTTGGEDYTVDWTGLPASGSTTVTSGGEDVEVTYSSTGGWVTGNIGGTDVLQSSGQTTETPLNLGFDQPVTDLTFEIFDQVCAAGIMTPDVGGTATTQEVTEAVIDAIRGKNF